MHRWRYEEMQFGLATTKTMMTGYNTIDLSLLQLLWELVGLTSGS
jgi:hypothetical protein